MNNAAVNDEIDLRDILKVIWKRKFWIAGFVVAVCAVTVFIVVNMDNIYESKAVLRPSQNNTNQMSSMASSLGGLASLAGINIGSSGNVSPYNAMNAILSDKDFIYAFVSKHKFEDKVIGDFEQRKNDEDYNKNIKFFVSQSLNNALSFSEDSKTGLITISFQNKDREFTKIFVDSILNDLSSAYRALEIKNLQERIDNYKSEIDKTNDITLKNKLADVVSGFIQNKVLSQAQEFYGFDIIIKPSVADPIDKVKPKRAVICILAFFLSLCLSIFSALVFDVLNKQEKGA